MTTKNLDLTLLESLEEGGMIVCVKDHNKVVLKQNDSCKELCGNAEGKECNIGCMEVFDQDDEQQWDKWGNRTYRNCYLHDHYYDLTLLCSDRHLITILQPLEEKQTIALKHYMELGLSKRETEVITHVIAGLSNTEICEKLSISASTIRTHLNNIYGKAHESGTSLEYIPRERNQKGGS